MILGYCIVIGIFGREIVYEKQHKIKWQFSLMGAGSAVYWTSTLVADFLHLLPSVVFILIVAASFQLLEYYHAYLTGIRATTGVASGLII